MAGFRMHAGVAAAASLTAATTLAPAHDGETATLALLGTVAGLLPDIDSDHSVPARLVFTSLALATAAALLLWLAAPFGWAQAAAGAVLGGLFVRFVLCNIFARITEHRGLFHSLPAALLAGLATMAIALQWPGISQAFAWLAGGFVTGGYLLHLLLDEIYAVEWFAMRLRESFGTALTIFSFESWPAYLVMYVMVALAWQALPQPF